MKKILSYLVLILLLVLIGGYFYFININNYKTSGTFEISGNEKPIQVKRDANGIPYVFAESKADAIRGQGFVTAQDRIFQIEFYRLLIHGKLSSVVGASTLNSDIKLRVLNTPGIAKANYKYLNQGTKDFLQWYSDGYNEYLKVGKAEFPAELGLLGIEPKPMTPLEISAILYYIGYNHGQNIGDEILSLNLASRMENAQELLPLNINPDRTKPLDIMDSISLELGQNIYIETKKEGQLPIAPIQLGSNNWVISGEKSTSGKPIVTNDPHLDARMYPGIFYPIGLFCPEFKAVGFTPPGVPGVMVGRNDNLAFGVTNGYGDSQDLFIEKVENNKYWEKGEYLPFQTRTETIEIKDSTPMEITIRSTVRGSIISDFKTFGILTDDVVSLRWSAALSQSPTIGLDLLLEAKNATEFGKALEQIDMMFFNYVYADTKGNIAHQSTGLIPQRVKGTGIVPQMVSEEDSWLGFIPKDELPNMKNPERGWVGTANHDTRPDDYPYYYSSHFSPNYRYSRIKEVLSADKKFDDKAMWQLVLDCKNKQAEALAPIYAKALNENEATQDIAKILEEWNFTDQSEAIGAAIYHAVHNELLNLILDDELPDDVEESFWANNYYWSQKMHKIILENDKYIDNINTPEKETLPQLIVAAGEKAKALLTTRFGSDMQQWTWGKLHPVDFFSPIRPKGFGSGFLGKETFPKDGSNETLNRGGYAKTPTSDFETSWFSSLRMVADLNDNEKFKAVLSGGSAARMLHPNYKAQLEAWQNEEWLPYWFTKEKVNEYATEVLILE